MNQPMDNKQKNGTVPENGRTLRADCDDIVNYAIAAVLPHTAVQRALNGKSFGSGRLILVSVGKAAYSMGVAAVRTLGERIDDGIIITKYGHRGEELPNIRTFEAGHPVPDENTYLATDAVLKMTSGLTADDTVLFLLSGGGSALFEKSMIPTEQTEKLFQELLASGADIVEVNTVRKHFSQVKGGRFAQHCAPARVFTIALSDIVGDPLDMIASGPAYPDSTTSADAAAIMDKYHIHLTAEMKIALQEETPKELDYVETIVTGSVKELCKAAEEACNKLGYETIVLTDSLGCEACEAGRFLSAIARKWSEDKKHVAILAGGETVVHLKGSGKGGRNQELALSAAKEIRGISNVCVFSVGSDGTDGPTDAAGGYADGETEEKLSKLGISSDAALRNNDAYTALKAIDGLIMTGPTGTNVNDVSVVLIR